MSKANAVIPVPPVNPSVQASPPLEPSPSVINHIHPALQAGASAVPNEGEVTYTSVPDPVRKGTASPQQPHDWTIRKPAADKPEDPPPKPISQVLMENLKSMWTASASAVQVEQVANHLNRPAPIQPTQIAGELTKQALVYQPSKIPRNEKL